MKDVIHAEITKRRQVPGLFDLFRITGVEDESAVRRTLDVLVTDGLLQPYTRTFCSGCGRGTWENATMCMSCYRSFEDEEATVLSEHWYMLAPNA